MENLDPDQYENFSLDYDIDFTRESFYDFEFNLSRLTWEDEKNAYITYCIEYNTVISIDHFYSIYIGTDISWDSYSWDEACDKYGYGIRDCPYFDIERFKNELLFTRYHIYDSSIDRVHMFHVED